MSGAAGISAAKNRRSKTEPNQKQLPPPISCGKNGNGSCPPQNKSSQSNKSIAPQTQSPTELVDPISLQILGPMAPVQILRVHEQRLNRLDERLGQVSIQPSTLCETVCQPSVNDEEIDDYFSRIETLESKLAMLEEVIMTLQNKLTIAQNFAIETNMSMTSLIKKCENLQIQQSNIITVVDISQSIDDNKSTGGQNSPITVDVPEAE